MLSKRQKGREIEPSLQTFGMHDELKVSVLPGLAYKFTVEALDMNDKAIVSWVSPEPITPPDPAEGMCHFFF